MKTKVELTSSTYQSDLPYVSNELSFRECKVPTLNLNGVSVTDGNLDNDKVAESYSSAYPFEFSQCGNNLKFEIKGNYECFDSNSAKINVAFYPGGTWDGK